MFSSSCTRVSIWFLLVFVCFFFLLPTSGYSHFSSTGNESGARLALEARHKVLSHTQEHVQNSTQVQAQICLNTVGSFAYFPVELLPGSLVTFSGYFNRTSFGFQVSGSLLHVTTYSRKTRLGPLFSLYCANFLGFSLFGTKSRQF